MPDSLFSAKGGRSAVYVSFDQWTGRRSITSIGTNAGAPEIPFQNWRKFKEAFPPEIVARAIASSSIPVRRCLDPFGGSGTTALACQFLGVHPTTIEVNPYLADLIQAKLEDYAASSLAKSFAQLVKLANGRKVDPLKFYNEAPATLVEPGAGDRWILDKGLAARLAGYVSSLSEVRNQVHRRLMRVVLGGVLVDLSNVVVRGKGRRYRPDWQSTRRDSRALDDAFCGAMEAAIRDIVGFSPREVQSFSVVRGDARKAIPSTGTADIAIFSPPYPNSFDYTDVYNIELWALRYLKTRRDNTRLRMSTLESHVQIKRTYARPPIGSDLLNDMLADVKAHQSNLWDKNIPAMLGGYFADMNTIIKRVRARLRPNGQVWMVIGDSRYAGVTVPVADIMSDLAALASYTVVCKEPFRSMRASAQQGGDEQLAETLLVLQKHR